MCQELSCKVANLLEFFQFVVRELYGNEWYTVKLSAGTKSIMEAKETKWGPNSTESRVYLPPTGDCTE